MTVLAEVPWDGSGEPPPPDQALVLAGWWPRVGAAVVDFFVRLASVALITAVVGLALHVAIGAGAYGAGFGFGLGLLFAWFVYAPLLMARWDGQTVGHRVSGTRVVMANGSRMSGGRAFVREALVKNLLIEGIGGFAFYVLPLVNYLFPLWDSGNEALHDKLCHTRVIVTS